ncbi:MAG: hypothetical protein ACMXYK_05550 [Candidatus Woesearchaeota archaeon]
MRKTHNKFVRRNSNSARNLMFIVMLLSTALILSLQTISIVSAVPIENFVMQDTVQTITITLTDESQTVVLYRPLIIRLEKLEGEEVQKFNSDISIHAFNNDNVSLLIGEEIFDFKQGQTREFGSNFSITVTDFRNSVAVIDLVALEKPLYERTWVRFLGLIGILLLVGLTLKLFS